MSGAAHIVALGAHTAVGLTSEASAAAVRAGVSRIQSHPFMVDARGESLRGALAGKLPADYLGPARLVALAQHALFEVVAKLSLHSALPAGTPLPVVLVLPEERPGFDADCTQRVQAQLSEGRLAGLSLRVGLGPRGHAGGLAALADAAERITQGQLEWAVVCGVDSYFDPDTIEWLESHHQLHGEGVRSGFPVGEGAGAVVLAGPAARARYRWPSLAVVRSSGAAQEPVPIKSGGDSLGRGMSEAVRRALAPLLGSGESVNHTFIDFNGERYRSEEWAFVLLRQQAGFESHEHTIATRCWGDVGAAWGPLACTLAANAFTSVFPAGPRSLLVGGSEAGLRAALVLQDPRAH